VTVSEVASKRSSAALYCLRYWHADRGTAT